MPKSTSAAVDESVGSVVALASSASIDAFAALVASFDMLDESVSIVVILMAMSAASPGPSLAPVLPISIGLQGPPHGDPYGG